VACFGKTYNLVFTVNLFNQTKMSSSPIEGAGLHIFVATCFTVWVVVDSLKRKSLAWGYAILSFVWLWCFSLPFYFAGRKLLPGETREGGYAWNVCKSFLLLWSFLLGYCLLAGMVNVSDHLGGQEMSDAAAAGAAIGAGIGVGLFFCLWIGVAIPTLVIGLLLKKNSIVEKGSPETEAASPFTSTAATPPPPAFKPAPSATTPPPQPAVVVSVARNGQNIGNFDLQTFRQNITTGVFLPTDHYWTQGMAGWELVANYKG